MPIQEELEGSPKGQNPDARSQGKGTTGKAPTPDGADVLEGAPASAQTETAVEEVEGEEREKVIVRSNGVVTYVGKDIAYQFWKLGLLGRDFNYRIFVDRLQGPLWATCTSDGSSGHPPFGGAAYVYNVIDVRQSYLQKLLKQALIAVGHPEGAERSHHFSYEMVALSHATARTLGYAPPADSEEAKRPFVEVSGRKGLGVKADDLLDTVIRTAADEVRKRNEDLGDEEVERIAKQIAIAAVRYFLVKFSRGTVIAFDLEEALSFVGETGPYIQYAVVRANKIFAKLYEREAVDEAALVASLQALAATELLGENGGDELWDLVLEASRLDEIVEQVIRSLEFSVLAKYTFSLAKAFNGFYNLAPARSSILNEERDDVRRWRAAGVLYVRNQLTRALDLMGVSVPPRM
jgi:arginyl-tRNA synthetase